jgi:photosystem II stability/assembly factor-like uncharacterized protein
MVSESILFAGTVGESVWRSRDGGETFARVSAGMFLEADVRALALHPHDPHTLYAGTNAGLYRTSDDGDHWQRLPGPFDPGQGWPAGIVLWSLLIPPQRPDTLFVGACPSALYRSEDAGASWQKLAIALTPECGPLLYSRVTCLVADPREEKTVWAGVEIDGVWRSQDGGEHWQRLSEGLSSQDIHALAIVPGQPRTLLAATNNDLNLSQDEGATWQPQHVQARFPHAYCRGLQIRLDDPQTVFLGNGNGPPGTSGTLQVSGDGGRTWRAAALPTPPNSTIWTFAANAATPGLLFCASVNGYLYRSEDGGATWAKCPHEFGEVRSLALAVS